MKTYLVSDLHLDFYCRPTAHSIDRFIANHLSNFSGDILFIAGDLSHSNALTTTFLVAMSLRFDHVVCVIGNHDLYNTSRTMHHKYPSTYDRLTQLKESLAPHPTIHLLDGDTITINDLTIGGCMAWHDNSYWYAMDPGPYGPSIEPYWRRYMNDHRCIPKLNDSLDLWITEKPKLDKVLAANPDVIITHYCPSISQSIINPKYVNELATAFYCFDYHQQIDALTKPTLWFYGHMHDSMSSQQGYATLIRNPLGYPNENKAFHPLLINL